MKADAESHVDLYWLPLGAGGHSVRFNGIVYEDDRLVVQSSRSKSCGPRPKVIIRVRPANSSVGDRHQPGADGAGAGKSRSRQSA